MQAFLLRRFAVWIIPIAVIWLSLPLIIDPLMGQLLGLLFMIFYTVLLVALERKIQRFGRWMHSHWGEPTKGVG